jgi:hypothetical protein
MKQKYLVYLFIFCALLTACGNTTVENAAPNLNTAANEHNAAGSAEKNAANHTNEISNVNSNISSNIPANFDKQEDFAGTAGITDKKYELKATAVLKEVRAAAHEGYDRAVFEFEGAELPSYRVEYIDKPVRACGSGNVVPLEGDGWLEIRFSTAAAHTEKGEPTVKRREQSPKLKIIKEMKSTCDFEAEVEWVLGVASPNKYRVLELKNPTRLAVDIKHK